MQNLEKYCNYTQELRGQPADFNQFLTIRTITFDADTKNLAIEPHQLPKLIAMIQ
jgi:hypothetical protein